MLVTAMTSIVALALAAYAVSETVSHEPSESSSSGFGVSRVSRSLPRDIHTLSHNRHSRLIRWHTENHGSVGTAFIRFSRRIDPSYWDVIRGMVDRREGIAIPNAEHHLTHVHEDEGQRGYDHALKKCDEDPKIKLIVSAGGTGYSASDVANRFAQRDAATEITSFPLMYAIETMRNVDAGKSLAPFEQEETASRNVMLSRPFAFFTQQGTIVVGCPSSPNAVECALNAIVPSLPALLVNARYTDSERHTIRGNQTRKFAHTQYVRRLKQQ